MDIDQNGYLSQKEIHDTYFAMRTCTTIYRTKYLEEERMRLIDEEVIKLFQKLDVKNDGQVDKEQFVNVLINDPDCAEFRDSFNFTIYHEIYNHSEK